MSPRFARNFAVPLCATLLSVASGAACAAGPDLDIGNAMLRPAASTTKDVGIGVAVAPGYLGGADHKGFVGIDVESNFGNGVFISAQSGIGYRFLETPSGWSMAASLGASNARREKDGDDDHYNRLRGMGDINAKVQANLFLNYDSGPFHANAGLHQTLAGRRGTSLDLSVGYDVLATPTDLVRASAGLAYLNRSEMQTFFGVRENQSPLWGSASYTPRAGIAGMGLGVDWRHAFSEHWIGSLEAGVTHLRGDAGSSPLTARRTSAVAGATINYRF